MNVSQRELVMGHETATGCNSQRVDHRAKMANETDAYFDGDACSMVQDGFASVVSARVAAIQKSGDQVA